MSPFIFLGRVYTTGVLLELGERRRANERIIESLPPGENEIFRFSSLQVRSTIFVSHCVEHFFFLFCSIAFIFQPQKLRLFNHRCSPRSRLFDLFSAGNKDSFVPLLKSRRGERRDNIARGLITGGGGKQNFAVFNYYD